jgi:hypothetical protein
MVLRYDPRTRVVKGKGLRLVAYRNCGFESRRGHGCMAVMNVVLSGSICDGPIPCPRKSVCVCVAGCD